MVNNSFQYDQNDLPNNNLDLEYNDYRSGKVTF